jgi:hypothetical protein
MSNVELIRVTGRLWPDYKTIANFRRDSGQVIRNGWRRFVEMCPEQPMPNLANDKTAIRLIFWRIHPDPAGLFPV